MNKSKTSESNERVYSIPVNRKYKDQLFRLVFGTKKSLLSLYNALTGADYQNPEDLLITTLEDVIYFGMKNDLSFILDGELNLYEHQSSFNPNLPIRGAMYFGKQYSEYIMENQLDIFSSTLCELPFPQFLVFYNGTTDKPERMVLKLSDAYVHNERTRNLQPALECTAVMLNINYGKNRELMEKCKQLKEYAAFVELLRQHLKAGMEQREAIMETINYCLEHNILKDILSREKERVVDMLLTECDVEYVKGVLQHNLDLKQNEVDNLRTLKEQLQVNYVQLHQRYIHDLLEAYKEAGISYDAAITRVQEKLPTMSREDIVQIASKFFE